MEEVYYELQTRTKAIEVVKINLEKAQQRTKLNADRHRKEVEFEVGDLVLVKLHPYRQLSVAFRLHNKMCQRFFRLT